MRLDCAATECRGVVRNFAIAAIVLLGDDAGLAVAAKKGAGLFFALIGVVENEPDPFVPGASEDLQELPRQFAEQKDLLERMYVGEKAELINVYKQVIESDQH